MKKKLILSSIALACMTIYADDFVTIINSEGQKYTVDTAWTNIGELHSCTNFSPLNETVYHGVSFTQNKTCTQDQKRTKNGIEETQSILKDIEENAIGTLYAASCSEELALGYNTTDGIYDIKFNDSIFSVYCDMTTDGGGWTNVNTNFGNISGIDGHNGISGGNSTLQVNGSLVSISNSDCSDNSIVTSFSPEFYNDFDFSEVKLNAKSFGGGDTRCGGVLRRTPKLNVVKFSSFNTGALYRCDNDQYYGGPGYGFSEERSQSYHHFKYDKFIPTELEEENRSIASVSASCSTGTGYLQIKSIMVR